ncbi:MAG: thioredoxin family protein, partial [Pseudomonadota bacterium]
DTLHGLITFRENGEWRAYQIAAQPGQIMALPDATAKRAEGSTGSAQSLTTEYSLGLMLVFAVLGGLILNLMPCVFPVLCLKILGLTQSGSMDRNSQRLHGVAYTLGVLASFALIAGILIALRSGGAAVGWGFQLQSPWVIALLVYLLFTMGLSLSGMVTFGTQIMGVGDGLANRGGYQGSFFTGILATVVATPCTAPFMATAVGFAATQSAPVAMTVFLALGFGLALPFLLLAWLPGWTRFLPKPGAWMETLKQFMAFPLYATVVWLLWVLGRQTSIDGLAIVLSGMILLAFALWAWQRQGPLLRIGLTVTAVALALGLLMSPLLSTDTAPQTQAAESSRWEPFSPERLAALRQSGDKPIFVNMTADWCITCLVNEQVALNIEQTRNLFDEKEIVYLKGDWTRYDSKITEYLAQFGRSGVPIYVLYPTDVQAEPVVLPQILTPGIVADALSTI